MKWLLILCFSFSVFAEETIAIFTFPTIVGAWDPDRIKTGITGSEEAAIYVSQSLAKLGYKVTVFAEIPPNSRFFAPDQNPRFVPFDFNDGTKYDIGIAWRMPEVADLVKKFCKTAFFWPHDRCGYLYSEEKIGAFDGVLWLSKEQRNQWCSVNPSFSRFTAIFGNGIVPEQFEEIKERDNPYSCIYASGYERGLKVLLDIWPVVKKYFPRATLDIYYGWRQTYNLEQFLDDKKLKDQVKALEFMDVKEHGSVGHEELNRAYGNASLWTYSCNAFGQAIETFCISALRAQFAGAVPVIVDAPALQETVRHGYRCDQPKQYLQTLLQAMREVETISLNDRNKQRGFILQEYTWDVIARRWKEYFDQF